MSGYSMFVSRALGTGRGTCVEQIGTILVSWDWHLADGEEWKLLPARQSHVVSSRCTYSRHWKEMVDSLPYT